MTLFDNYGRFRLRKEKPWNIKRGKRYEVYSERKNRS